MVSVIAWSNKQKISYVHELLLVNPSREDDHSKLTSVITVLYEYKYDVRDNRGDDKFDINFLQRGLVKNLRQLLPYYNKTASSIIEENNLYNKLINFSHKKIKGAFKIGKNLPAPYKGYEGTFNIGIHTDFNFESGKLKKHPETLKYENRLKENIPFSILSLNGKRTHPEKGKIGIARIAYEIGTEIEHRDRVDNCAYFDNMTYNIMTPARVIDHLKGYTESGSSSRKGSEIEKRIRSTIEQRGEAWDLINNFRRDLRLVREAPFTPETDENYKFELLIVGMDKRYRYTAGCDTEMKVRNLENYTTSEKTNAVLIGISPKNSSIDACLPLTIQKRVNQERCKKVDSLEKEIALIKEHIGMSPSN